MRTERALRVKFAVKPTSELRLTHRVGGALFFPTAAGVERWEFSSELHEWKFTSLVEGDIRDFAAATAEKFTDQEASCNPLELQLALAAFALRYEAFCRSVYFFHSRLRHGPLPEVARRGGELALAWHHSGRLL